MTPHEREVMQMALEALESSRVFVTSREKIKHPEGTEWHDERIEALRAALAQPEPAECDGGQCGIGAYCKECPKPLVKLKEMLEVQGRNGTWNYDPYFHGMYNGMEVMLAVLEGREPVFREAPKKWLSKKEWVGLTYEEYEAMAEDHVTDCYFDTLEYARAIEAKLKEKNT